MDLLTTQYSANLSGVLSCCDRYPKFALPLRRRIRENAVALAALHGVTIECIAKARVRKEDVVAKVVATRGAAPGLVLLISAMETCATYRSWRAHLLLVPAAGGLQRPLWLARRLSREAIDFTAADNAFVRIADSEREQQLADTLAPDLLHRHLDRYARLCCPVLDVFEQTYQWSVIQAKYSMDLVFKREHLLEPLYEQLSREAVLSVRAEQVATLLCKKITPQLSAEIGSRPSTRIERTCIKHRFGSCSLTTTNDVSLFEHHHKVEHSTRYPTREVAPPKKSIYSLVDLCEILLGCNQRYVEFLSSLDDHSAGQRVSKHVKQAKPDGDQSLRPWLAVELNSIESRSAQHSRRQQSVTDCKTTKSEETRTAAKPRFSLRLDGRHDSICYQSRRTQ